MDKIVTVAIREFVETVRSKAFIIGAVFMPVLMVGLIFGVQKIARRMEVESLPERRIAVVDHAGVYAGLAAAVEDHNRSMPMRRFALEPLSGDEADSAKLAAGVRSGALFAYLIIPADAVSGDAKPELGRKETQLQAGEEIEHLVNTAVVGARFARHEPPIDEQRIRQLQRPVDLRLVDVRTGVDATGNKFASVITPFAFMFFLWMGTISVGQGLLTSMIEEKGSRIVEVLLSAVSPIQLMAGKILGMVCVGLLLMSIWTGLGYYAARSQDMEHLVTMSHVGYLALYFLPTFLFSAALQAAIGSVCNTLKDAQSFMTPIVLVNIIPMLLWMPISQNPSSMLSQVLSFVPPISPFVMILRVCSDPGTPIWQIAATLVLCWASVFVMIWAAGKIFRVGVLMYGKPPTPREMLRWLRYA
jgi:ABC-2 type transport system permease protein